MYSFHTILSLVNQLHQRCAFIVRYNLIVSSLWRHRRVFEQRRLAHICRFDPQGGDDYPYRSHGQPFTAFASLAGCIFILVVADGAALWKEFQAPPFLSAYLSVRQSLRPLRDISSIELCTLLICAIASSQSSSFSSSWQSNYITRTPGRWSTCATPIP